MTVHCRHFGLFLPKRSHSRSFLDHRKSLYISFQMNYLLRRLIYQCFHREVGVDMSAIDVLAIAANLLVANVFVPTKLHFQRRIFQQGEPRTEFSSFSSNLCDVKIHCLQKYFCNATLTGMSAAFGAVEPKNITLLGVVPDEFLTWCDDVDIATIRNIYQTVQH
jgi:hypothetical protein